MVNKKNYNAKLIEKVYSYLPAFTDIFDEEAWYIFISAFVTVSVLFFLILSKFVKLKPVEW